MERDSLFGAGLEQALAAAGAESSAGRSARWGSGIIASIKQLMKGKPKRSPSGTLSPETGGMRSPAARCASTVSDASDALDASGAMGGSVAARNMGAALGGRLAPRRSISMNDMALSHGHAVPTGGATGMSGLSRLGPSGGSTSARRVGHASSSTLKQLTGASQLPFISPLTPHMSNSSMPDCPDSPASPAGWITTIPEDPTCRPRSGSRMGPQHHHSLASLSKTSRGGSGDDDAAVLIRAAPQHLQSQQPWTASSYSPPVPSQRRPVPEAAAFAASPGGSAQTLPQLRATSNISDCDGGLGPFTPTSPLAAPLTAPLASQPPPPQLPQPKSTLLAVGVATPDCMRRPVWSLLDYQVGARLYKGPMSAVYKATCLHSRSKVILKVYNLDAVAENALHMLVREVRIHTELAHASILVLYGVFEEENRLVLVLERAARGDLYRLNRSLPGCRMSEDQARALVLAPLLDALVYLHGRGVCHRDIKPENLLMNAHWQLWLADFGSAINLAQERAVTRTGTVDYMAPEVERCPIKMTAADNKERDDLHYTTTADVWSVGVLTFELLVGFPPFIAADGSTDGPTGAAAEGRELHFPPFVSAGAQDFIASALAERPGDRPTAAELQRHPWLKYAVRQHQLRMQKVASAEAQAAAAAAALPALRRGSEPQASLPPDVLQRTRMGSIAAAQPNPLANAFAAVASARVVSPVGSRGALGGVSPATSRSALVPTPLGTPRLASPSGQSTQQQGPLGRGGLPLP